MLIAGPLAFGWLESVEPPLFQWMFRLAYGLTLLLILLRLVELIGLWRSTSRLLRDVAMLPMVRAFDRLPAQLAQAQPTAVLHAAMAPEAKSQSDPWIDRQFLALINGCNRILPGLEDDDRLPHVDTGPFQKFLREREASRAPLKPAEWWKAVDAVLPLLAPFWVRRTVAASYSTLTGSDSPAVADEWPGLEDESKDTPADRNGAQASRADNGKGAGEPRTAALAAVELAAPPARPRVRHEEIRRWLRDAEELIAVVLARQLTWLRDDCSSIVAFLVIGLLALTLVVTSYPFQPQWNLLITLGLLAAVTVSVIVAIAIQTNRDEVTSRMTKTKPNQFTLDGPFLAMLVTYVVPLVGLVAALSFGMSDLIRSWFEPLFR